MPHDAELRKRTLLLLGWRKRGETSMMTNQYHHLPRDVTRQEELEVFSPRGGW